MQKYEKPEAEVVIFETVDVVATSSSDGYVTEQPAASLAP